MCVGCGLPGPVHEQFVAEEAKIFKAVQVHTSTRILHDKIGPLDPGVCADSQVHSDYINKNNKRKPTGSTECDGGTHDHTCIGLQRLLHDITCYYQLMCVQWGRLSRIKRKRLECVFECFCMFLFL